MTRKARPAAPAPAPAPAGPLPHIQYESSGGFLDVPADAWRWLDPDSVPSFADTWLEQGFSTKSNQDAYGPKRLGGTLGRTAYPTFQELREAVYAASYVVRQVGLSAKAVEHLVFCDTDGEWWALPVEFPYDTLHELDEVFRISGKRWDRGDLPPGFFRQLDEGGWSVLEWAFHVINTHSDVTRRVDQKALQAEDLAVLVALPEWQALKDAARRNVPMSLQLERALNLTEWLSMPESTDDHVRELGKSFDAGADLGWIHAAINLRDAERAYITKPEIDWFLRSHIVETYGRARLPSNAKIARDLLAERDKSRALGKKVTPAYLPTQNQLERLVADAINWLNDGVK